MISAALSSGDRPVPHKIVFDEAPALLVSRVAAYMLEPKDRLPVTTYVIEALELLAIVEQAIGSAGGRKAAEDYRDLTGGRTLVVTRVESGSLIATLTDLAIAAAPYVQGAIAVGGAIKGIADLVKLLKSLLGKDKSGQPDKRLYRRGRKKPGVRSAEALLKIAADSRGEVRLSHKTPKGETLEFKITPVEAIRIREGARASDEAMAKTSAAPESRSTRTIDATEPNGQLPALRTSLDRVYQAGDGGLSDSELEQIAEIIIGAIEGTGLTYLVDQIVRDLHSRGLHRFAMTLARRAQHSQGKTEPPLTST
jgi:hypothetical protein